MSQVITARIDEETLVRVDKIAKAQGRSRAWFAARAIERAAEAEAEFLASLDEAEAEIAKGEYFTQQEMEAWFEAKVKARSLAA